MPHGSDVNLSLNVLDRVLSGTAAARWRRFRSRFFLQSRCKYSGNRQRKAFCAACMARLLFLRSLHVTSSFERRPSPSEINRNAGPIRALPTTLYNFTDNAMFPPQNLIPRFEGNTPNP